MEHYFNDNQQEQLIPSTDVTHESNVAVKADAGANSALSTAPTPLLMRIETAYQALQAKLTANQVTIQKNREQLAQLRARMRELVSESQFDQDNDEAELHNSKVNVQGDSCQNLISHAEQIREHIYHNSAHAEFLLNPLKQQVELLALRIQHVRAIEQLLADLKAGMALQDRLSDITLVIETLAQKLEVTY